MNAKSIQKLRIQFICIFAGAILLAMVFLGSMINLTIMYASRKEVSELLDSIIANDGSLPEDKEDFDDYTLMFDNDEYNEDSLMATRYFAVIYDDEDHISRTITEHISTLSDTDVISYAKKVSERKNNFGRIGIYYYKVGKTSQGKKIIVLVNAFSHINSSNNILYFTVLICIAGLMITLVLVVLFSKRAIKPEIENNLRQRQFITNASHELKTPLAVIRANTELIELMNGENEWTQSTMRQIERMDGLIKNLVMISRSQEYEDHSTLDEVDVSKSVRESTENFDVVASQNHLSLEKEIPDDITMIADDSKIRQLTSLLVDNAIKYCDEEGRIQVRLAREGKGKGIRLTVSNSFVDGANVNPNRFFDRFYRDDSSHNIDKGGYGIGLSIAQSICQQYRGSIRAVWKNGRISFICLLMQPVVPRMKFWKGQDKKA